MPNSQVWVPQGTVYGSLLNFEREWGLWAPRMVEDPYKNPPKAPVLYLKSANTYGPAGQALTLQDGVLELAIGATLGLVMGEGGQIVGTVLMNDWSVPHDSYFRPPVKYRCRDGFLAFGAALRPYDAAEPFTTLTLQVAVNHHIVQTVDLATLRRPIQTLLDDVSAFMTLQPGDVLMVGTDCLPDGSRPLARAGDQVVISAPGYAPLSINLQVAA